MKKLFYLLLFFLSLSCVYSEDSPDDIKMIMILNDKVSDLSFMSELEQDVVRELNLARMNPGLYSVLLTEYKKYYDGMYLKIPGRITIVTNEGVKAVDEAIKFLKVQNKISPFKISKGMSLAARDHVADQSKKGTIGHTGSDKSTPFTRMNRYGNWLSTAGENIDYGNNIAREIVFSLIIDDGVSNRGHRTNIFNTNFEVVGVACGEHKTYRYMCVMTFAKGYNEK